VCVESFCPNNFCPSRTQAILIQIDAEVIKQNKQKRIKTCYTNISKQMYY